MTPTTAMSSPGCLLLPNLTDQLSSDSFLGLALTIFLFKTVPKKRQNNNPTVTITLQFEKTENHDFDQLFVMFQACWAFLKTAFFHVV